MKTGMKKVMMLGMASLFVFAVGCARYRASHNEAYPATSPTTVAPTAGAGYGTGTAKVLTPDEIKAFQQELQQAGFNPGAIDGTMTPQTAQAIRQFQQANNLPVTGNFDFRTEEALRTTTGQTTQSPSNK